MAAEELDCLRDLFEAGEYEEAEARARALAAAPRRVWGRSPMVVWLAKAFATAAAAAHGRGTEVLAEMETLIAELERAVGAERTLLLAVRENRVSVLVDQERHTEAEAEAQDILRGAARLALLTEVWRVELSALANLAAALCGQDRYEEAEAIARGNLPRAEEYGCHPAPCPGAQPERAGPTRGGFGRGRSAHAALGPCPNRNSEHGYRRSPAWRRPPQ